mgnify:CR=1 FL=1
MIKQYIKQSIQMLKENRLVSVISIAGTAISIAMIMVPDTVRQFLSGEQPRPDDVCG